MLPQMSLLNPRYLTMKQRVFQNISAFVEKFKGVGGFERRWSLLRNQPRCQSGLTWVRRKRSFRHECRWNQRLFTSYLYVYTYTSSSVFFQQGEWNTSSLEGDSCYQDYWAEKFLSLESQIQAYRNKTPGFTFLGVKPGVNCASCWLSTFAAVWTDCEPILSISLYINSLLFWTVRQCSTSVAVFWLPYEGLSDDRLKARSLSFHGYKGA